MEDEIKTESSPQTDNPEPPPPSESNPSVSSKRPNIKGKSFESSVSLEIFF